jgi:hypothetical protein
MISVCAWCERFLGLKEPKSDPTITHGICKACFARQTWEEDTPVLVVSRDREYLVPVLEEMLRGLPEIPLIVDRRHPERRAKGSPGGSGATPPEGADRPVRRGRELILR